MAAKGKDLRSHIFGFKPFTVRTEIDVLQGVLFIIALISRLWRLEHPRAIVFDEMFYGRFASMYSKNVFYYDAHPPLGKMLIALSGYLGGSDFNATFDKIGAEYPADVPVWFLRIVPALSGCLLIPVSYQIIVLLGYKQWTAGLAGLMLILDNALLTQSRFILMEMPMVLSMALAILCYLKLRHHQHRPYSSSWWAWLIALGISLFVTIGIKYTGVFCVALILFLVGKDFWNLLPHPSITNNQLWMQLLVRVLCLLVLPIIMYVSLFYVHLSVLYKAGPHDDIMTSSFQASLQGGLASITKNQPIAVAYGSQITLRQTYGAPPCWLHSHRHVYPVRYSDTRGSSHQQQVTCYSFKDTNNWWIVKDPMRNKLMVDDPVRPVRHGDVIQLIHGLSSRALNSHDVAAPVSPQHQEVSCYVDYNISFPAQNLWRVELVDREDSTWKTIESHVRLVHLNTSKALKISGRQLPDWGFNQFEVVADKNKEQLSTVWNVEEHRYTRTQDEEAMERDIANSDMVPLQPVRMGFFAKFWELQTKMLTYSKDAELEHRYSSDPTTWPLMEKNIAYWYNAQNNAQIHLLGNLSLWVSVLVWLLVYVGLLIFYILRRHRGCYDIENDEWYRFRDTGWLLLAGYLTNYVPFYMTDRTLFLYHYIPALYFSILLTATLVEHVHDLIDPVPYIQPVYEMLVLVWLTSLCHAHIQLSVFSYGNLPLSHQDIKHVRWRETWDFLHKQL